MKKPDIGIGYRAAVEVKWIFPKKKHGLIAIGCGKNTLNEWGYGAALSAIYLARLHELGTDIEWILTGRKYEPNQHI